MPASPATPTSATTPRTRKLIAARGPLSWGEGCSARSPTCFDKPGPGACTDCHTEHQGAGRDGADAAEVLRRLPRHARPAADAMPRSAMPRDFGNLHPQFAALIETAPGRSKPMRVSLAAHPKQWDGLALPARAASRSARRRRANGFAHRRAAGLWRGARVQAIATIRPPTACASCRSTWSATARRCHSLVYDKVGGDLPHAAPRRHRPDAGRARAPTARRARPIVSGRRRPGEYAPGGLYYSNFAGGSGAVRAARMSPERGVRRVPLSRRARGRLGVMPVIQPAAISRTAGSATPITSRRNATSCHAAKTSQSSSDLLLPGISRVPRLPPRRGSRKAKVPSGCAMCHSYHPRARCAGEAGADRNARKGLNGRAAIAGPHGAKA